MIKKIEHRITEAFRDASQTDIVEFAKMNRNNLFSIKKNIKNVMFLIFGTALFFELTMNSEKTELALHFFKFEDVSSVCKAIPLLMSYFYYELMILFSSRKILLKSHSVLLKKYNSLISNNGLDEIFAPISTFSMTLFFSPKWKKLIYYNGGMIGIIFTIIPIGFIIYSYIQCFSIFGADLLLIILIIFTLFFTITAITLVYKTIKIL